LGLYPGYVFIKLESQFFILSLTQLLFYFFPLGPCIPGSGTAFEGAFTERRGLTLRRFLLAVAPQVSESPLQYHLAISDSASVRAACDQMSSVGWEMLVLSYGSGFNLESSDPNYISRVAADVAYCNALNVEVGGYDLIGWTRDPGNGWSAVSSYERENREKNVLSTVTFSFYHFFILSLLHLILLTLLLLLLSNSIYSFLFL